MLTCSTPDAAVQPPPALSRREKWRTTTALMEHQVQAVAKLLPPRVGGAFMDMGTGKSRVTIELACRRQEKIDRVIWFCPVSLKETIRREILKHTDCDVDDIYVFDDRTAEDRLPADRLWYIVGIESMSSSPRVIFSVDALVDDRTMVVCDESTYIKGAHSARTRRITTVSKRARYRLILTGTPITQGYVDLFAQMSFLSPKILGYNSFYSFARNHLIYSDKYKGLITGSKNVKWLTAKIRPYVYQVTKEECLDLPDKVFSSRHCHLTPEQEKAYDAAKEDFIDDVLKYDDGRKLQNGIAVFRLFSRLQAIVCGIDDRGGFGADFDEDDEDETRDLRAARRAVQANAEPVMLPHNRLNLLRETMAEVHDKHIVVWAKYHLSIDEIAADLQDKGRPVYVYDGRVKQRDRDVRLDAWRAGGGVLVASLGLGSHGLDLTASATSIHYANGFKYSQRIQAEDRFHRIGQTRPVNYIDLWSTAKIEDRIAVALDRKANALTALRQEIDKVKATNKKRLVELIRGL